jgi:hypothetical protein
MQQIQKISLPVARIRFIGFAIILCGLAFITSNFSKSGTWAAGQWFVVFTLIALGLLLSGISLQMMVFASVAMLPTQNSYIPLVNFSLTLTEIFMTLFLAIFALKQKSITKNKFTFLFGGLFLACIASLIGSPLGFSSVGMLLRYGIVLMFVTILISRPLDKSLFQPVFYGLLAIPFMVTSSYAGEDALVHMFTVNILELSRVVYSFQYPIWYSLLLPFLVFIRATRLVVVIVSFFIIFLIVFSFARSIIVGTMAAGILFICFYKNKKPLNRNIFKALVLGILGIIIFVVGVTLNSFDFITTDSAGAGQAASTSSRFEKMAIAFEKFKEHPLLGSGFGAAHDERFAEQQSRVQVFKERISPEFGPLNVLAEVGLIGGLFLFSIIAISFKYSADCLGDRNIPMYYKLVVLITFGGFVSSFLNSNSLNSMTIYIFLVIPILLLKHLKSLPPLSAH